MNQLRRRKTSSNVDVQEAAHLISQLSKISDKESKCKFIDNLELRLQVLLARQPNLSEVFESYPWDTKQPIHFTSLSRYLPLVHWYLHKESEEIFVSYLRIDFYGLSQKLMEFVVRLMESLDKKSDLFDLAYRTFRSEYKTQKANSESNRKSKTIKDAGNPILLASLCFQTVLHRKFILLTSLNIPSSLNFQKFVSANDIEQFDFYSYVYKYLNKPLETISGLADQMFQIDVTSFSVLSDIFIPDREGKLKRPPTALGQFLSDILLLICKIFNMKELKSIDYPLRIDTILRLSKFFKASLKQISLSPLVSMDLEKLKEINLPSLAHITFASFSSLVLSGSSTLTRTQSDTSGLHSLPTSSPLVSNNPFGVSILEESYISQLSQLIFRHSSTLESIDFSNSGPSHFVSALIYSLETTRLSAPGSKKTVTVFPSLTSVALPSVKISNELFDKLNSLSTLQSLEIGAEGAVQTEKLLSKLAVRGLKSLKLVGCTINHPDLLAEVLSSGQMVCSLDLSTCVLKLQRLEELIENAAPRQHGKLEILLSLRDSRNIDADKNEINRINGLLNQKKKNIEIVVSSI